MRSGAFTVYRSDASGLSDDQHADALVIARLALDLFLALQAGHPAGGLDQLFVDGTANRSRSIRRSAGSRCSATSPSAPPCPSCARVRSPTVEAFARSPGLWSLGSCVPIATSDVLVLFSLGK